AHSQRRTARHRRRPPVPDHPRPRGGANHHDFPRRGAQARGDAPARRAGARRLTRQGVSVMHKHRPAEAGTAPTRFSARQTVIGLVVTQGLRQRLHGLRNGLALTGKLARVLRGETLHPVGDDPRFADPTWHLNPLYRRGLQAYLACQQQCLDWIEGSNLSAEDRDRVRFLVRQLTQALSPSNGPLNPQALKECFDTGGASLARGLRQLLHDPPRGMPNQVPPGVFRLGANLATSRGAVVLRNEVLELIQYQPMTPQRHAVPLLIVPAQLNKFYIFDLNARKS